MEHDVFISYSSKNKNVADAICHVLEGNGIRCWIAPRDIPPGTEYGDMIDKAIIHSKVVVVIFSETAASSQWVKGETNVAFEEQKTIIPFRLDNTPLEGQNRVILNQKHWIDAFPDYKIKFNDLVEAVAHALGRDITKGGDDNKNNYQQHKEKIKNGYMHIIMGLALIVAMLALYGVYRLVTPYFHSFNYDKQGLHVNVKGLNAEQEEALTSILDNMVLVEGGTFTMGNNYDNQDYFTEQDSLSRNPHKVELGNFYIGKYELTQKQWKAFASLDGNCIEMGDDKAMDKLSWEIANAFADTLSALTGLQFSLPTEAQWEYAARGGNKSKNYAFAGHNDDPTEVAWTSFEKLTSAHNVGGKRYNELELYDMSGNVSEWCKDYYAPYTLESAVNPQGPSTGINKVLRGGDFRTDNLFDLKTTTRFFDALFVNRLGAGMRIVINIKEPTKQ